jgi:hypothetical protein
MVGTKSSKAINVWIAALTDERKHCRNCEAAIGEMHDGTLNQHISAGEYVRGKYRKAFSACGVCLVETIAARLHAPAQFAVCVRSGHTMPWYFSTLQKD